MKSQVEVPDLNEEDYLVIKTFMSQFGSSYWAELKSKTQMEFLLNLSWIPTFLKEITQKYTSLGRLELRTVAAVMKIPTM